MTGNEFQALAMRTETHSDNNAKQDHALHGMVGEIGEIHSIYQKVYQGHPVDEIKLKLETGDLLWFIAEYIDAMGWNMDEIMEMNIEKLKKRFPNGFDVDRSINRTE